MAVAQWTKRNENKGSCFESNKNKFKCVCNWFRQRDSRAAKKKERSQQQQH